MRGSNGHRPQYNERREEQAESTAGERLRFPRPRAFLALLLCMCTYIYLFCFIFRGGYFNRGQSPGGRPREPDKRRSSRGARPIPAIPSEPPPLRRPLRSAGAERPPLPPPRGSRRGARPAELSPRPPSLLSLRGSRAWLPLTRRPPKSLALIISVVVNYPRGAIWLLLQPHRSRQHHTALGAGLGHPLPIRGSIRSPLRDGSGPPASVTAGADSDGSALGCKMPSRAELA